MRNKIYYITSYHAIMKKIPLQILILVSLLMNVSCSGQEKILNHEFEPTASDFRISKYL